MEFGSKFQTFSILINISQMVWSYLPKQEDNDTLLSTTGYSVWVEKQPSFDVQAPRSHSYICHLRKDGTIT